MTSSQALASSGPATERGKASKALAELSGLLRAPYRIFPLGLRLILDKVRSSLEPRHLYAYCESLCPTEEALRAVVAWIYAAQRRDGGIAAYYSLLTGYSESYPEVTGYIIPTLYDFGHATGDERSFDVARHATQWLRSLQMPGGAFPAGLHGDETRPSVFNTGQILFGLTRAYRETGDEAVLSGAAAAGKWLASAQSQDGSWSSVGAYQGSAHTYYSMVSWALAQLAEVSEDAFYGRVAERNLDWVLGQFRPGGWIDGINLRGHPTYLHFIAYVIQGVLECGILLDRKDAIQAASISSWNLLRKFETRKHLAGAYQPDFKQGRRFACLTGNAQMACVWLRLFEVTRDLRYLNAALKMNELLKQRLPLHGRRGVLGGVAGSFPTWGDYQPLRYISWGCKFLADSLLMEQRALRGDIVRECEAAPCAS